MASTLTNSCPVSPEIFSAIQNADVNRLSGFDKKYLRPILPTLYRMSKNPPIEDTDENLHQQKSIALKTISETRAVDSIINLININFKDLEQEVLKEFELIESLNGNLEEYAESASLRRGTFLQFEEPKPEQKFRIVIAELLNISCRIKEPGEEFYMKSSDLFDSQIYLEVISDILVILQIELPTLFPLAAIAESLLHVSHGAWLLCCLVANNPAYFLEVCKMLISQGPEFDNDLMNCVKRTQALTLLCNMCPSYRPVVRSMCIEHRKFPGFALALTLKDGEEKKHRNNIVLFILSLLLDQNADKVDLSGREVKVQKNGVSRWFSDFLKNNNQNSSVKAMREILLNEMKEIVQDEFKTESTFRGCTFIKFYSSLVRVSRVELSAEETNVLFQLVTLRFNLTSSSIRFISMGLCILFACPKLIEYEKQKVEIVEWLKWLIGNKGLEEDFTFLQLIILIAIHFRANHYYAISDLIKSFLGIDFYLNKTSDIAKMRDILTFQIYSKDVASLVVKIPVTTNLSENSRNFLQSTKIKNNSSFNVWPSKVNAVDFNEFLPAHCVYHLLEWETFSRHGVSIKNWICKQVKECTLPIHPIIPQLIEKYVASILNPNLLNDPISEVDICAVFDSLVDKYDNSSLATKLLYLFYLLNYQDVLQNQMNSRYYRQDVFRYSQSVINQLPIRYLLKIAQPKSSELAGVYSKLLNLVSTHYPHLCFVEEWMEGCDLLCPNVCNTLPGKSHSLDTFTDAIRQLSTNPKSCINLMGKISAQQPENLLPFCNVLIENLPLFLEESVPKECQEMALTIWNKMNMVNPNLKLSTINALRSTPDLYSLEEVVEDPLIILRCDSRAFGCPPILEMILSILNCFLHLSKSYLDSCKTFAMQSGRNQEEAVANLVASQESAAIHILMDNCLVHISARSDEDLSRIKKIQRLVFVYIHRKFVLDMNLAKLILFQGYPMKLVPLTVEGISSLHIYLNFLPELLSNNDLSKICFAFRMASYLGLQYRTPKCMIIAKLCLDVMDSLLSGFSKEIIIPFYYIVLPDLARFCKAFPILCDEAIAFLFRLASLSRLDMAEGAIFSANCEFPNKTDFSAEDDDMNISPTLSDLLQRIFEGVTIVRKYSIAPVK